jgi:hypothetical protein|tara:strand:+ start:837 stop:1217 length:381 start_codon:yes stop_codon:yes gene_type:complete
MIQELWTPSGAAFIGSASAGDNAKNAETGGIIEICVFQFRYTDQFGVEHKEKVIIPRDETISKAHVEDMAAQAYENFISDCKKKYTKRAPTVAQKKEIGKALNEFRSYALRRRESSRRKIYYEGIK